MSKRAEKRALEAYPMKDYNKSPNYLHTCDSKMLDEVYRDVFKIGYLWAEKDLSWISVKESLPKPGEWVLACISDHNTPQCLTLAIYTEETGKWHTDNWEDGEPEEYFPDYWMKIPDFE